MTAKIVRLSEIKTNSERRQRKQIREELKSVVKYAETMEAIGYVSVLFDKDGGIMCFWDTEQLGSVESVRGEIVKRALDRTTHSEDTVRTIQELFEE